MLIDNHSPDKSSVEAPYVLESTSKPFSYSGNIYVDFVDAHNSSHRQQTVFYAPTVVLGSRKIIEGVYSALIRKHNDIKPTAGTMLLELLTDEEKLNYLEEESKDDSGSVQKCLSYLGNIHDVPPVVENFLYRRRIDTTGRDFVSYKTLPNYQNWKKLWRLLEYTNVFLSVQGLNF